MAAENLPDIAVGGAAAHGDMSSDSDDDDLVIFIAHAMQQYAVQEGNDTSFNDYWQPLLAVPAPAPPRPKAPGRTPNSWLAVFARGVSVLFAPESDSEDDSDDQAVHGHPHGSCELQAKAQAGLTCAQLLALSVYLEEVILAFWSALQRCVELEEPEEELPDENAAAAQGGDQGGDSSSTSCDSASASDSDNGEGAGDSDGASVDSGSSDDRPNVPRLRKFGSWNACVAFAQRRALQDFRDPTPRDVRRVVECHHGMSVSVFEWVFLTVHDLAKSPYIRTLPAMAGVGKSTISIWIRAVLCALSITLFQRQVYIPEHGSPEWEASRRLMFIKSDCKLADCVGAIDDTHIHVCISEERGRHAHINYKGDSTLALQAVVSADLLFWYCDGGKPGRGNDRSRLITGKLAEEQCRGCHNPGPICFPQYVLGDSGYWPGQWWLPTPYCARPCPAMRHSIEEIMHYNAVVAKARVVVEQAFGVLFACFRSLKSTWTGNLKPDQVLLRLQSCIALHNFRIRSSPKSPSVKRGLELMLNGTPLHRGMIAISRYHMLTTAAAEEGLGGDGALQTVLGYEEPLLVESRWASDAKRQLASRAGASHRAYLVDTVLAARGLLEQERALHEAAQAAQVGELAFDDAEIFNQQIDGQNVVQWVQDNVLNHEDEHVLPEGDGFAHEEEEEDAPDLLDYNHGLDSSDSEASYGSVQLGGGQLPGNQNVAPLPPIPAGLQDESASDSNSDW